MNRDVNRDVACRRAARRAGLVNGALALAAALMAVATAGPAPAQPVTLKSSDGSATVTGPLVRFDGSTYTIKSGAHDALSGLGLHISLAESHE